MKNKKRIIQFLLIMIFLIFGFMVRYSSEGILFDMRVLEFFHKDTKPFIFKFMNTISYLGSANFLIPIIAIIITISLIKKKIKESLFLLVNTLGSFILNSLIKQIFQRTRPFDFSLVKQGGLSYPSGHSMVVMSMYLAIFYLLTKDEIDKSKKNLIGVIVALYILFMGISRMYLGVHWPTDIIGGYIAGYLLYDISKLIFKIKIKKIHAN